jgi:hypothetical protein
VLVLPGLILMLILTTCGADDIDTEGGGCGLDPDPGANIPVGVTLADGQIDMPSIIPPEKPVSKSPTPGRQNTASRLKAIASSKSWHHLSYLRKAEL